MSTIADIVVFSYDLDKQIIASQGSELTHFIRFYVPNTLPNLNLIDEYLLAMPTVDIDFGTEYFPRLIFKNI